MELRYVVRELLRNPRRSAASLLGIALGVGLFSSILFFVDGSGASMTQRALAPLVIDQQRVLGEPLGGALRLHEQVAATGGNGRSRFTGVLPAGAVAQVRLTLANAGAVPANEVVVSYVPRLPVDYVPGSARIDGRALTDLAGSSPFAQGSAQTGLNLGTIKAGRIVRLQLRVRVRSRLDAASLRTPQATLASREQPLPAPSNAPAPPSLDSLLARLRQVPGVATADGLALVDLAPGSLSSGRDRPLATDARLFSLDDSYARHYPSVRLVTGALQPGGAVLSVEAARALHARQGGSVSVRLPGGAKPLRLPITGIADLSRARSLFTSRKSTNLENFLYVADSVVIDPKTFRERVLPAYRSAAAAAGTRLSRSPLLEADLHLDRHRLRSDPGAALGEAKSVATRVQAVAPGADYLIDNASNTLQVARDDATVARRMFVFLGSPGALLGALLAVFAGGVLASAQRREHAMLRLRGAHAGHLLKMLVIRSLLLAGAGSLLGTAGGLVAATIVLGTAAVTAAGAGHLLSSALVAIGSGLLATSLALYLPGRRALHSDLSAQRHELLSPTVPAWRRRGLDLVLLAVAIIGELVALHSGAFDSPPGSTYAGQAVSLPSRLLVAPVLAWLAGVLVVVRLQQILLAHIPLPRGRFGSPGAGTLLRSLRRRSWALAGATTCVALVVGFGTALAAFAGSYDSGKRADARYLVGGDIRVTSSPLRSVALRAADARRLHVSGVANVTPTMFSVENAVLTGPYSEDRQNLAAVDPAGYLAVSRPPDRFFEGRSAAAALGALQADTRAVLVDSGVAQTLQLRVGDQAELVLARGTPAQHRVVAHIVGLFRHMPGFPDGATMVTSLTGYRAETGVDRPSAFLIRTGAHDAGAVASVARRLHSRATRDGLTVETTQRALGKDQSSLTALNVQGLVRLDRGYTLLMTIVACGIFVFGLLLERRREYVTLRAQGATRWLLPVLVTGEAATVGVCALLAGVPVGVGMGALLVYVLQPLFVLPPTLVVTSGSIAATAAATSAAVLGLSAAGAAILRTLSPTELLRDA